MSTTCNFLTSILAFISTNIDDIFLLMLFYGDRRLSSARIIIGQYLGIAALIGVSLALSMIGLAIGKAYVGLLGFLPVYIGLRGVIDYFSSKSNETPETVESKTGNEILMVAGVTIANGGDNIGIYTPLFGAIDWIDKLTMIIVFMIMTGLLCVVASHLTSRPVVSSAIDQYGHAITPFVLIGLGIYILVASGAYGMLLAMTGE